MMKIMTRLSMKSMPNRYTRREAVFSGRRRALRATSPTALAVGVHGSNLIRGLVFSRAAATIPPFHMGFMHLVLALF